MKLLDVVAVTCDLPEKGLVRGQMGTVVEVFDRDHYEVEFVDREGSTYAMCALPGDCLMQLHDEARPEAH